MLHYLCLVKNVQVVGVPATMHSSRGDDPEVKYIGSRGNKVLHSFGTKVHIIF